MTILPEDNLIGFYASFMCSENDKNQMKEYLWGLNGLKSKLSTIKWHQYGNDFHIILFQFYVKPIPSLRDNLKEIENFRPKEKSIGIPVIIDDNFFNLNKPDREIFLKDTILYKLDLLKVKIKRNKLDLQILKLKEDISKILSIK